MLCHLVTKLKSQDLTPNPLFSHCATETVPFGCVCLASSVRNSRLRRLLIFDNYYIFCLHTSYQIPACLSSLLSALSSHFLVVDVLGKGM